MLRRYLDAGALQRPHRAVGARGGGRAEIIYAAWFDDIEPQRMFASPIRGPQSFPL